MKRLLILVAIAFSTIAFTSCEKNDETKAPDRTSQLVGKIWKLTALTVNPPINTGTTLVNDLYAQMPCYRDNIIKFERSGAFMEDEGAVKCFNSQPQTTTGTWIFNPAQTIISATSNGNTFSFEVVELNNTTFKYTDQEEGEDGIIYTFTYTFTAQ